MTARPPVETREASSEGSSESLETGDSPVRHSSREQAQDPLPDSSDGAKLSAEADEAQAAEAGKLNRSEPSISRTLEAILSKSDADDDLSVPPDGEGEEEGGDSIGTRTLLGIGASGLPLPPRPAKAGQTPGSSGDDERSFSVEDVFDDEGTAVSSIRTNGKGRSAKGGEDRVGDLLDEVAEALNSQASSHDSTVGALPGKPVPPARPIRADVGSARKNSDEFEFEDPDDGPTTLNVHGEHSEDVDVGEDDDEAVVLGPARLPPSRPAPIVPARAPSPSVSVSASATAGATKNPTPFSGLAAATLPSFPAPASGRSRLPTPGPAQALGLPPPGRAGLPVGTPVDGVPTTSSNGDASRRATSGRATVAHDKSAGHNATAAVMESLTSAMESASVVLKKDVKFRVASLAGVVAATFVVGLLIGRAVMGSGKKTTAEASETVPANEPAKAPAVAARAPAEAPVPPPVAAPVPVAQEAQPAAPPAPPAVAEVAPEAVPSPPLADGALPAPAHKRRARRAILVPKDEPPLPKPVASKPMPAAPKAKPAPAAPAPKKKSTWHDPFAD